MKARKIVALGILFGSFLFGQYEHGVIHDNDIFDATVPLQKVYDAPVDKVYVAEVRAANTGLTLVVKEACMVRLNTAYKAGRQVFGTIAWTVTCVDLGDGKTQVTLQSQAHTVPGALHNKKQTIEAFRSAAAGIWFEIDAALGIQK